MVKSKLNSQPLVLLLFFGRIFACFNEYRETTDRIDATPKIPANHCLSRYKAKAASPMKSIRERKAKNIPHQFILQFLRSEWLSIFIFSVSILCRWFCSFMEVWIKKGIILGSIFWYSYNSWGDGRELSSTETVCSNCFPMESPIETCVSLLLMDCLAIL